MLSLTASKFGRRPSELLGLVEAGVALDFDTAAALRLQRFEQQFEARRLTLLAAVLTTGSLPDFGGSAEPESEECEVW